jgi:hypothetical protein
MAESGFTFDRLVPSGIDYAWRPIEQAFEWRLGARPGSFGTFYLVAFRSIRRADVDRQLLTAIDGRAYEEACSTTGFVHYFKGPLASDRSCLSFCLWDSRESARAAARLPAHMAAVAFVAEGYERYTLELYRVIKRPGRDFAFEPYDRVPAGDGEIRPAA